MGRPVKDLTHQKFERLLVVSRAAPPENAKASGAYWNCVCDCGTETVVYGVVLTKGEAKSCGCLKKEKAAKRMKEMQLKKYGTLEDRLMSRFIKLDNGCWQWTKHKDKDGYGILPGDKKNTRAHRLSYEMHIGEIPENHFVCHKCDNPSCINPDHLFVGTAKDNNKDALQKRRNYIGEKNGKTKLTWDNVNYIRSCGKATKELAKMFGVTKSTINNIKGYRTWKV